MLVIEQYVRLGLVIIVEIIIHINNIYLMTMLVLNSR